MAYQNKVTCFSVLNPLYSVFFNRRHVKPYLKYHQDHEVLYIMEGDHNECEIVHQLALLLRKYGQFVEFEMCLQIFGIRIRRHPDKTPTVFFGLGGNGTFRLGATGYFKIRFMGLYSCFMFMFGVYLFFLMM